MLTRLFEAYRVKAGGWSLIYRLVQRDIVNRTSGTLLGGLWLIAQPALQVVAFWFLLDVVLVVRATGTVPFIEYFLTAMVAWLFLSEVLSRSLNVLTEYSGLYQRTLFPINVLPMIPLIMAIIIYTPVLLVIAALFAGPYGVLDAVVIIIGLSLWVLPITYLLAVIGLFFKESRQVFPFILTLVMYFSPILYQPNALTGNLKQVMQFNPVAGLIACIQNLIHGLPMETLDWIIPLGVWLVLIIPAAVIYTRAEPHMREEL
jgi:lipopolysaccharide transport system permease protein